MICKCISQLIILYDTVGFINTDIFHIIIHQVSRAIGFKRMTKCVKSSVLPDDVIFQILYLMHPFIHFVISKNQFRKFFENYDEYNNVMKTKKLPVSLLISLNSTATFENFYHVVLSYSFRDKLALQVASKGNLSTLQWFHSNRISWDSDMLLHLATRGELESIKWAILNKLPFINGEIKVMNRILQQAAYDGQENILEWALNAQYIDLKYVSIVLEYAARGGQLNIIRWFIRKYPLTVELLEKNVFYIFYGAAAANKINILEWIKTIFPNEFWIIRLKQNSACLEVAANNGHLHMLEWLKENRFLFECGALTEAAVSSKQSSLEVLKYLRSANSPWSSNVCIRAVEYGRLDILLWAVSNGCPWKPEEIFEAAARSKLAASNPDILHWLKTQRFQFADAYSMNSLALNVAIVCKNFLFVRWAVLNLTPIVWDDRLIKNASAAGDLPALIWAMELNPENIDSQMMYILSVNAAARRHLHILEWLFTTFGSDETNKHSILHPQVCVLAAKGGYLNILQWAVDNGCYWSRYDCCKTAIRWKRIKILIWMKYKPRSNSTYWYGETFFGICDDEGFCDDDTHRWLVGNVGNEEGVYFDEKTSLWRSKDLVFC